MTWKSDGGEPSHIPALHEEVLDSLAVKADGRYVDCTVGGGGHSQGILERSGPRGLLLGLDVDPQALEAAEERLHRYGRRVLLVNENFRNLKRVVEELRFGPVDGILLDLGISSMQLADGGRGFSFQAEGPLDMRLGPEGKVSARDLVNTLPEDEFRALLARYGEVARPRKLARAIIAERPVETTVQLSAIAERAYGRRGRIHPATNLFRALRMSVNDELGALAEALPGAVGVLVSEGRLAVISYHSLEDREVKLYLRRESRDCLCPTEVPVCVCGHKAKLQVLTKKPIVPAPQEVRRNPRARSAKLRVASRLP